MMVFYLFDSNLSHSAIGDTSGKLPPARTHRQRGDQSTKARKSQSYPVFDVTVSMLFSVDQIVKERNSGATSR
jgi:hypothetical protein